ncbi:MAG: sulfite exporter TauE/SafE family protein [Proteobacteria bacterium]|nr:sulfite exporter TauE/SafE family protein [Pseudomonadota bacterium]
MSFTGELFTDVAATLFVLGLSGGFAHCIAMCGPLVMAQVSGGLENVAADEMGELHRLTGGLLMPYHLGRMTTYVLLGALVATVSGGAAVLWDLRWLKAGLLGLAAVFFATQALKRLGLPLPRLLTKQDGESGAAQILGNLAKPLFSDPPGWRGYGLGIILGFLPCGLVYGALAATAADGDAARGALGMAAFSIGTMPALMATGVLGQLAGTRLRKLAARIAPLVLLFGCGFLIYMAWRTLGVV